METSKKPPPCAQKSQKSCHNMERQNLLLPFLRRKLVENLIQILIQILKQIWFQIFEGLELSKILKNQIKRE